MSLFFKFYYFLFFCLFYAIAGHAQDQRLTEFVAISLDDLDAFKDPGDNWTIASGASVNYAKPGAMKAVKGKGIVVNISSKNAGSHLITNQAFGDLELELDFMMAKGANSGVYLQGRYEVQLFDSWTKLNPAFSDCGGIYQRWDESREDGGQGYQGIAPYMNVAKAPGLWQHLKIIFKAPQFNGAGEKIANARFEEVYLNGVLVQQQMQVTGPTQAALFSDEKAEGPIMLQGDHGKVAFRNIRYRSLQAQNNTDLEDVEFEDPIIIEPKAKPYLLRSFLNYGDEKLTHVISVGSPRQVNYSYDMEQGALLQVWRGQFLDVTDMWHERGEPQLAKPLGNVIPLSGAPVLAVLANENAPWPDSVAFDDLQIQGYVLDKDKTPTFQYALNGTNITDKVTFQSNGESLIRELSVKNPPSNLYCRVASGDQIEHLGKDLYAIDDKSYYIQIDKRLKPIIRQTKEGQEIIVPFEKTPTPVSYSIIW